LAQDREAEWKSLMLAAIAGDEAAYRRFLTDVSSHLRGWARGALTRAGRSPAEAEDIVQDTLIAIHTRRHTWDASLPIGPWLHGVARHKLVDALRRRTGHDHLSVDDFAETIPAPAQDSDLAGHDVLRMLATLPARQADIVRSVFVEGQRGSEVGQRLGMTEGAVRVALHRALKTLAGRFAHDPKGQATDESGGEHANR
jgi:RNA polymerase sigma-70 factor, ECF subfamily